MDKAVTELIAALEDRDWAVRCDAVRALEQIGPAAKEAMPALLVALKDRDSGVRLSAPNALRKIQAVGKS